MTRRAVNLIFFCYPRKGAIDDFREVARRIAEATSDIAPYVYATSASPKSFFGTFARAFRPTLTIEMDRPKFAWLLRGHRFRHQRSIGRLDELRRLAAAGLAVPKWTELTPDTRFDRDEWGAYVVVKPLLSRRGAYVWIRRIGRVRYQAPSDFPEDHPGRRGGMIVQRFIYTGRWPAAYRVLTYFGNPVAAIRYDGRRDLPALEGEDAFRGSGGGSSIVASAMGCTISCVDDADILDVARRASAAFPDIPSLGVDVVREAATGKLYVLEVNPGGDSWMLSSGSGRRIQAQFGLDFYSQFGALDIIAKSSAEMALRHAR